MPKTIFSLHNFALMALMFSAALIACTSTHNQKALEMQNLLAASGFEKRLADTPEKLAQAKQLPQRQLIAQELADRMLYVYADAYNCQCVYAGNEEAYRRYQRLARDKQIAEKDRLAEERNKPSRMDWGDWRFYENW
jgi:hypothetical protein